MLLQFFLGNYFYAIYHHMVSISISNAAPNPFLLNKIC